MPRLIYFVTHIHITFLLYCSTYLGYIFWMHEVIRQDDSFLRTGYMGIVLLDYLRDIAHAFQKCNKLLHFFNVMCPFALVSPVLALATVLVVTIAKLQGR